MAEISTLVVLATKGVVAKAETVAGHPIEVVEFFNPDVLADEYDESGWGGITVDVPIEVWSRMGGPTEITMSFLPGNQMEEYKA